VPDTFAVDTGLHQLLVFHVDGDLVLAAWVTVQKQRHFHLSHIWFSHVEWGGGGLEERVLEMYQIVNNGKI
jgi:hypothetical protein